MHCGLILETSEILKMKLRVGIIGLSTDWRNRYLPALRVLRERFEIAGVYHAVGTIADNVARECGAQRFDGFRDMLAREDVDAAMVLSSDWYGLAPLQAACDFGKAVYCGSQISFAPEQAAAFAQTVEQSGVAFMAEFPRRYAPATLRLKELIATRLGQPQLLFCHRRLADSESHPPTCTQKLRLRESLELIDWCAFVTGNRPRSIQSVCHVAGSHAPQVVAGGTGQLADAPSLRDYQSTSIDFSPPDAPAGSTIAQISSGSYIRQQWHEAANFRPPASLQVCCENGLAFVDLPNGLTWFDDAGRHQESLETEVGVGQQLLTQFHRAVTSLVRKMGDLGDVMLAMQALQAAEESIDRGQTVSIR